MNLGQEMNRINDLLACNRGDIDPHSDVMDALIEGGLEVFAIYESKRESIEVTESAAYDMYETWFNEGCNDSGLWAELQTSFIEERLFENRFCDQSQSWCLDLLEKIKEETDT